MRASRVGMIGVLLSFIGLGLCGYLTVIHIALLRGELIGGAACGASGSVFNCHAVTASPWGSLFGIPLSVWGSIGYLATLALSFIAWQFSDWTASALAVLSALALLFVAVDAVLFIAMTFAIHYFCPLCLATYAVNVLLLVAAKSAARQRGAPGTKLDEALETFLPKPRVPVVWIFWGVLLTGSTGAVSTYAAARFAIQGPPGAIHRQLMQFISQQPRVTVDTSGDPSQGQPNAPITLIEFSDFHCPSCQRASTFNPLILAGHRRDVVFIFKHYPLDQACNPTLPRNVHPGSCRLAAVAECAHEQGKFWELHDRIFAKGPEYQPAQLNADAAQIGLDMGRFTSCLDGGRGMEAVKRDIAEAQRIGVTSTPTYVINGLPTSGVMPPSMFDEFLRALHDSGS